MDRLKSESVNYSQARLLTWLNLPFLLITFVVLALGLSGSLSSLGTLFSQFEFKAFLASLLLIAVGGVIVFSEVGFIRIGYTEKGVKNERRFWQICVAFFTIILLGFVYNGLFVEKDFYSIQPLQFFGGIIYLGVYVMAGVTALRNIRKTSISE